MTDNAPDFVLSPAQWQAAFTRAGSTPDALEDGAYVRAEGDALLFYASALNKPGGWRFPFPDPVPGTRQAGAIVGQAQWDEDTGRVQLDVTLYAAVQAVTADYESDATDMDYVTYENAAEEAGRGTPSDALWLRGEFTRLLRLSGE